MTDLADSGEVDQFHLCRMGYFDKVGFLNPKHAAAMGQLFLDQLRSLIKSFAMTEASQRRLFFEQELRPARDKLTDAEWF